MAEVLFSLSNPVFKDFVWYTTVVVLKLLAMAPLTARHRFAKGVCIFPKKNVINLFIRYLVVTVNLKYVHIAPGLFEIKNQGHLVLHCEEA